MRKSIGGVHPEMLKDTDKFPSELELCRSRAKKILRASLPTSPLRPLFSSWSHNILTHGENMALQTDFSTRTIRMQTLLEKQPQTRRNAA